MKYNSFKDMPVWKKAIDLSVNIFHISDQLPRSEYYGLSYQIRRSSGSVHANIAEGFEGNKEADKRHFYILSLGSAFKTQSHLIYGQHVNYFTNDNIYQILEKMMN
ncbi:MAG: four helix bundle protein [Bacteroidales bacterium]|nr:four helix bundle protein [Bacteroidales bacterium]